MMNNFKEERKMSAEDTTSKTLNNGDDSATTKFVVSERSVYDSVEALLQGAKEKEAYITKLLQERDDALAKVNELSKKSDIVEQLKQIRETKMDTENTNTPLPEDAIKQIALNALQEQTQTQQAESNLANCKQAVASISNGDVDLALKNKANELGCTVEYLENIAKTSPKAFKSMFGIKEQVSFDTVNFLQSSRQTASNDSSNEATEFFKSKTTDPRAVAEFMKKAVANPSLLDKVKW